jgi:hypothetical protein
MSTSEMPKLDPPATAQPEKKRRGRPPGSKNKTSAVVKEAPRTVSNVEPEKKMEGLSNEDVGKVFSGTFMLASLPLGPHWRLFPHEASELGNCFGPIFRRYPEKVGPWMDLLMCGPAVSAVVIPRIGVQQLVSKGEVTKEEAVGVLRVALAYTERQKNDAIASLEVEQSKIQAEISARMKSEKSEAPAPADTGVVTGVTQNAA